MLYIFEVTLPGTWLDYEDLNWTMKMDGLLRNLKSQFFEANAALNLFEEVAKQASPPFTREQWHRDAERQSEIRRELEAEAGPSLSREVRDRVALEAIIRFKREKWSAGHVPRELRVSVPFIYARAFIYALDGFDRLLEVLAKEHGVPEQLSTLSKSMASLFPDLRGVRNSAHHMEQRTLGLAHDKPITLRPVNNAIVQAPYGGVLMLNVLSQNRYGCTMSDGHYGEVEVSQASLHSLLALLQEVIQSFAWRGPAQHEPSAD
jgi:hypothetical protein